MDGVIKGFVISLLCILCIFTVACSQQYVNIEIESTAHINPDHRGQSLPVSLRLYQLHTAKSFEYATFYRLWRDDKAALGESLIDQDSITILPNNHQNYKLKLSSRTHYIGLMAVLDRPYEGKWRKLVDIKHPLLASFPSENIKIIFDKRGMHL